MEHDAERLRPPMHPTRSSAGLSPPSSPGAFASRPPIHPSHPSAYLSSAALGPDLPLVLPPQPSPSVTSSSDLSPNAQHISVEDQGSDGEAEALPAAAVPCGLYAGPSTDTFSSVESKDEGELSEVQLRELYDDEEVERFLKVFSAVSTRMAPLASKSGLRKR